MAVDVTTSIIIHRPIDVVAEYAADPSNAPDWYANIDSVLWRTEAPVGPGSQITFVARFLGRRLEYTYDVPEFVPGERLIMRTADGPFPMETVYTWTEPSPGSTRMTLRNHGEPAGFSRFIAPFMSFAMRRANNGDLRRLRQILEPA